MYAPSVVESMYPLKSQVEEQGPGVNQSLYTLYLIDTSSWEIYKYSTFATVDCYD